MRSLILSKHTAAVTADNTRKRFATSSEASLTKSTRARAITLAGYTFSPQNNIFLRALARTKGYATDVWVPLPTAQALRLVLRRHADPPVRITHANGDCLYYHNSQFRCSLEEMQRQWRHFTEAPQVMGSGGTKERLADAIPIQEEQLPLNTNGERFEHAAELQMIEYTRRHGYASRYWATPQEAGYLFQSPFRDPFLGVKEHGVEVANIFTSKPLLYYNVSGTTDPSKFTPEVCRRYDPYNFHLRFYRPITAIQLKRSAIEHDCVDQQQWITPERAKWWRVRLKSNVKPVVLIYKPGEVVQLVNVNMTENPKRLKEQSFVRCSFPMEDDELVFQTLVTKK
ncbi:unnamed protein product [Phytomonas sp. EM1]|nr:unnamed protein product [Phytomonas sp. EM1]|eukprot:CCW64963.1 unnamed protein product [Phytomonas sp. isolate EM1]